jgi:hypothetical protein
MKSRWLATLGLIVLGVIAFGIDAATAQTTANGPYYATPSWDQKLQCDTPTTCPRFVVLANWNSAAVLDRETGLVWEKAPSIVSDWRDSVASCVIVTKGGRFGWRLPTAQELTSLIDLPNLTLPPGHPFTAPSEVYWTATSSGFDGPVPAAWVVSFQGSSPIFKSKTESAGAWCVRGGGQGLDAQ